MEPTIFTLGVLLIIMGGMLLVCTGVTFLTTSAYDRTIISDVIFFMFGVALGMVMSGGSILLTPYLPVGL